MASKLSHLLVLFFLLNFFYLSYVNSIILFSYNIYIVNGTPNSVDTHCYLRGGDVGDHPLAPNEFYTIGIPIVVKGDNHVFCDIIFGGKKGKFELFNYDRDLKSCDMDTHTCYWDVQEDGLCMRVGDHCILHFNWN